MHRATQAIPFHHDDLLARLAGPDPATGDRGRRRRARFLTARLRRRRTRPRHRRRGGPRLAGHARVDAVAKRAREPGGDRRRHRGAVGRRPRRRRITDRRGLPRPGRRHGQRRPRHGVRPDHWRERPGRRAHQRRPDPQPRVRRHAHRLDRARQRGARRRGARRRGRPRPRPGRRSPRPAHARGARPARRRSRRSSRRPRRRR